jgi:hypothetical protein
MPPIEIPSPLIISKTEILWQVWRVLASSDRVAGTAAEQPYSPEILCRNTFGT